MTATTSNDVIALLTAELAIIGRIPTSTEIHANLRAGFTPSRYLVRVDGIPSQFATNRGMARVRASAAGRRNPNSTIEVEYRPTGERAPAALDGSFVHHEGVLRHAHPRYCDCAEPGCPYKL